jgi:hypothetical protein
VKTALLGRRDEEIRILERMHLGERVESYNTVRRRNDGSLVEVSLTVSPIKDIDGKTIGASKIPCGDARGQAVEGPL